MEKIYYPRTIDSYLLEWKNERAHKPLLLRGARQVGKSSAVRQLGKTFKYFMEVNFERDKEIISVFTGNLKPKEITSRLAAFYGIPVVPGETLLFLDEIQACTPAIHSLWFFYEDYPELHVVAAGSLLEFALKKMAFSVLAGCARSSCTRCLSTSSLPQRDTPAGLKRSGTLLRQNLCSRLCTGNWWKVSAIT